ncbi:MAG TPA: methyltransferase domain-containing protein [Candidatus Dormibacteraeota bacterium]|nr:methyltransferase domain-containing protein [Candidatus Dormibacteraeota bacterium]
MARPLEISDLIVRFDSATLEPLPVSKSEVVAALVAAGDLSAARIVQRLPERAGHLDEDFVKHLLVEVHCEIQRLAEEFQHGQRMRAILAPLVASMRGSVPRPVRVVDVGCGTGYVLRWLAKFGALGQDVELIGVDFNRDLVEEAARLAAEEGLDTRFEHGDALRRDEGADVYISTGVLHHIELEKLAGFFERQRDGQAAVHFDFRPSRLAWLGSWVFHQLRMRHPLSRHDGVVSALRAYPPETLLRAARRGLPGFDVSMRDDRALAAFHILVARRPIREGRC